MADIKNIKDFQNTVVNQTKYFTDNVLDFKSHPVKYNPFTSMNFLWQSTKVRNQIIEYFTLPLLIQGEFWKTWHQVYYPKGVSKDAE